MLKFRLNLFLFLALQPGEQYIIIQDILCSLILEGLKQARNYQDVSLGEKN